MTLARQRALTVGLIVVGVLTIAFFGLRTLHAFREFRGHRPPSISPAESQNAETDVELIREWMTIPFIAHMYRVHPKSLFDAVGISPKGNEQKSLHQLNDDFFPKENGIVMKKIKAAILANQPPFPPNTPSLPIP